MPGSPRSTLCLLLLLLAGCAGPRQHAEPARLSVAPASAALEPWAAAPDRGPQERAPAETELARWTRPRSGPADLLEPGDTLLMGYVGAFLVDDVELDGGGYDFLEDPDIDQVPLLGGGGQWVLGGRRIDVGLEGGFALNFRTDGAAVIAGGGGAAVAVDVDLMLLDVYGGPFASLFLGERVRVHAAAGPLMQFADYDQEGDDVDDVDEDGSGFGVGYYVRTGIELVLPNRMMLGVGARWSESTIDLSGGLSDLELTGTQLYVSVTTGL